LKRSRLIMSVAIVAVVLVICGAGSYISWAKLTGENNETKAGTEANKNAEAEKPAGANESEKAAETEKPADANEPRKAAVAEKPGDANDVGRERPARRPTSEREGRMGGPRMSTEEREKMRERFQNMSEEEREKFRAQMRERFGGERRPGGERGPGSERRPGRRERVRDPNDPNAPSDPNAPAEPNEPSEPIDPNNIMEALNLKDVAMKDVIQKLAEWTGKVIIPADDAMQAKITIYSAKKLPRRQALSMIYTALRAKGIVAEYTDNVIELKPIKDIKLGPVPTVPADQALAMIENKKQVVQKFFKLVNYNPSQMGQVVQPLIGEHGYVSADETTGQLLVIDTVENLMRIERIITVFDVPEAGQTIQKVFEIQYGDPAEIVQLLRILLGGEAGSSRSSRDFGRGGFRPSSSGPGPPGSSSSRSGTSGSATSVVIGPSQMPVILIPEQNRRWIIARASPEDMKLIEEWITKLDRSDPIEKEYDTIPITYADVSEVATRLNEALQQFPGAELKTSVLVTPLTQARQIMVFGRKDRREMVRKLIEEIDIEPGVLEQKVFKLKYADPEQIKENIDSLYGETRPTGISDYYWLRYGRGEQSPSEIVKVIAFPTMQQVTVIASPENMRKIEKQIEEWDVPLDVEKVKPLIITLRNSDPVQMADLLSTLFSESTSGRVSYYDLIFGYGGSQDRQKIVGPLYGQLTFEAVPDTKKIIIISKMPEAYKVIEELVRELDTEEMGEVPKVVTLKYADPEDLAERLNAMFNEPGTVATFRRSEQTLSAYEPGAEESDSGGGGGGSSGGGSSGATSSGEVRPWWTTGRPSLDEMPISNVIGRIRFVPDPRTKSILVLSPPEFLADIVNLISDLDVPGKQVMIKAVIVEVEHRKLTSLGVEVSTNPTLFAGLEENAIEAVSQIINLETAGHFTFDTSIDLHVLIDFLIEKLDAKILNQQTLWTKDNEEARFFKGKKVPFLAGVTTAPDVGATQEIVFEDVGMTMQVRPSITPEKKVDMVIRVDISQLTTEREQGQSLRDMMESKTNMIVEDAQTTMLGGILFQEKSSIERKLPLLGDMPVVGGLFRHSSTKQTNNEMIVFITPYVIDEAENMLPETKEELEKSKEKLDSVLKQLQAVIEANGKTSETQ